MPTIPLYDDAMFTKLRALRDAMAPDWPNVAPVFVPVGPDPKPGEKERPPIRILFVGQTGYQNETGALPTIAPSSLTVAAGHYAEAKESLLANRGRHTFWRAVNAIIMQTLGAIGAVGSNDWTDRLTEIVGWSNLDKIHLIQEGASNPPEAFVKRQAELCAESLQMEIQMAQPTVTIFMSGNWAQKEILEPACGAAWHQTSRQMDRVAVCEHPKLGPLLWINHPTELRFGKNGEQSECLGFVAGYAAALALSGR